MAARTSGDSPQVMIRPVAPSMKATRPDHDARGASAVVHGM